MSRLCHEYVCARIHTHTHTHTCTHSTRTQVSLAHKYFNEFVCLLTIMICSHDYENVLKYFQRVVSAIQCVAVCCSALECVAFDVLTIVLILSSRAYVFVLASVCVWKRVCVRAQRVGA